MPVRPDPRDELDAILARLRRLGPSDADRLKSAVDHRLRHPVQAWFCDRIPYHTTSGERVGCDGKPHGEYNWPHARVDQWPPADQAWLMWLLLSGRGSGKTRTAAEWVRMCTRYTGRIAAIGRRGTDFRATMIEGDSGLIRVCENAGVEWDFQPTKREFTFSNGAKVFGFTAEEPDSLRGPQFGAGWIDEPAHMPLIDDVWDNLLFGLRLPGMPGGAKIMGTTTPLPTKWIKKYAKDPKVRVGRVSTYANLDNLDPTFRDTVLERYEGTRLGKQELHGEILKDVLGALWDSTMIGYRPVEVDDLDEVAVGVDPAGTANKRSDETGIIGFGATRDVDKRNQRTGFVLADKSGKYSPAGWAEAAIRLAENLGATQIIAEKNFGGDMVKSNIDAVALEMNSLVRVRVVHASRSKSDRAQPIVGLYEKGRIFHKEGAKLEQLETEQLEWVPEHSPSPNRIDALVHVAADLMKAIAPGSIATARDDKI